MTLNYVDPWEGRSTQPIRSAGTQPSQDKNNGFFGDLIDSLQQGAAQSFAGDAEAIGQVSGSDTFKSLGKSLAQLSNSQTQTMTDEAQQALSQHIFKDDANNMTGVAFDDGATNWRTWALQFGVLGGQVAGTLATGFGAGSVVKAGAKTAIKAFAKEAVTKEAQQLVAKNAVKEAIRNGALDDVRSALVAAPDKAAINSVLNTATDRLGGIATTATAGAIAAGMRAQQARDEYLGLDADTLNQNPEFQKEYWAIADLPENQGLDTATIHNAAKNQLAEKAATTAFFDKTALLSDLASGAYVPGVGGVLEPGAATASKLGRFGIGLAEEGATEAWQGGETQRAVNEAIKEWGDESRDPMAGVIQTRWEEGTLGGVFGGLAKVAVGQHHSPSKPIITVDNSASTGNSALDNALAQSNADEQSRYNDLTDHVDTLTKPAFMRNGEISPTLESAITRFRMDEFNRQQAEQNNGVMQPFDNPVTGNPDEPAFLRSRSFNPTGRDVSGSPDVNPDTPVQQALARSVSNDNSIESQLADAMAKGDQGKTPQEDFVTGEWLRWDQRQPMSEPNRIESGVTMPGESREILPESRGLGYNNQINMPGQPGNGINDNYVPPITQDRTTGDKTLGIESTRDPRSPVAQAIAQAGTESDSIFGQLKSLRVTKKGKPFSSVKEAQLASRKTETPIELPTGGYGVVDKKELAQAQAIQAPAATVTNDNINTLGVNDTNTSDINQPADSAIKNVLGVKTEKQSNNDGSLTYRFSFNDGHASVLTHSDGTAHIMDVQIGDGETAGLRGKGVGTKLYEHIGNELAKDGVTLESTRWSKHQSAISPAALRVWEKLEKAGAARVVGHENARVLDRFSGVNEVRDIPIYEFTSAWKEASQATVKQIDSSESASTPVIAQNQPDINVNESSNGQATADQLSVPATSDTATTNESVKDGQSDPDNLNIIEHTTGKNKIIRGVVRKDLTVDEAKAIDPYTFKKDGGYFIREKHLDKLPPVKASAEPAKVESQPEPEVTTAQNDIASVIKDRMDAEDLVNWIAKNSENESYREIAKRIAASIPSGIDVMVVKAGEKLRKEVPASMNISNGMYWTKGDQKTLILKDASFGEEHGLNEETALHELIHAATMRAIREGNKVKADKENPELSKAVSDLYALQKAVVKHLDETKDDIGLSKLMAASQVKELVAWGMTNKEFQGILQKIPYENKTAWNKFVSLVAQLLGLKQSDNTALGELIRVTDNILSATNGNSDSKTKQSVDSDSQTKTKISDFGEKIGGAKKDVWQSMKDTMRGDTQEEIKTLPLSKAWPEPDYQKLIDNGMDGWTVGFIRAARESIPTKPKLSNRVSTWADQVKVLRDLSVDLADGNIRAEHLKEKVNALGGRMRYINRIMDKADLYHSVGHGKSLESLDLTSGQYSIFNGEKFSPSKVIWSVERKAKSTAFGNWPRMIVHADTKEQVIQQFKALYESLPTESEAKKQTATFDVFSKRDGSGFYVGKKIGRNPALLAGPFDDVKSARQYKEEHTQELIDKLEKFKEIPNERRDTNNPRIGEDMRGGKDVTPEMFADAFGFRGVEFGNWVEQSKRQSDLNRAYDALMDLAAIVDIPPKAISLNGELGIAFGARGNGGVHPAAAHYEPGKVVINLTKKNGAGSLGHEWWHAVDDYFARMRGNGAENMTESRMVRLSSKGSDYFHSGGVRKEMVDAFGKIIKGINDTAMEARSSKLDAKRSKDYWTTKTEMSARAFESYLISKLQDQNASNDYLSNVTSPETWEAAEKLGFELDSSYPYPTAGEIPAIRGAFDHFFSVIDYKTEENGNVALFSKSSFEQNEAEKSGKGMTKPEAELAAKEWLKQFKSDINVVVAKDDAGFIDQMEQLGHQVDTHEGETLNAAYINDSKTLVLNASAIQNAGRLRQLMRHEILVHYGLRNAIGDDAYIKVINALVTGYETSPSIKSAIDSASLNYSSEDLFTQMEEAFAHYAENSPVDKGAFGRLWDRVVGMVKSALQKVGLMKANASEAELDSVLKAIAENMRNEKAGAVSHDSAVMFSHDGEADPFKPNKAEADSYREQLSQALKSLKTSVKPIILGKTPAVLKEVGMPDLDISISRDTVRKATNGVKHDVPMSVVEQLPELISDPAAVFASKTEDNSFVVLVEAKDDSGRPVIVALHANKREQQILVNRVASIHGRPEQQINGWVSEGFVRYVKNKNPSGSTQGLQLPQGSSPARVSDQSIITAEDIRNKSKPLFSKSADSSSFGRAGGLLKEGGSSLINKIKEGRSYALGTLTDLQIDQIYKEITGGAVSRYQKLRTKMEADRNDILLDAETNIDPLWDAMPKAEKAALSNLMHDATMSKLHPDMALEDNTLYQEVKEKLARARTPDTKAAYQAELDTIKENHKTLSERYRLSGKQSKDLYQKMRDVYTKQWSDLRDAIEQRIEDQMGEGGKALASEMRLKMEQALKHGPYFPLARFGKYVIRGKKGDQHFREHFEKRKDAEAALKQYRSEGFRATLSVKEEGSGDQANAHALGMEIMEALDKAQKDGTEPADLKDAVWQAMLEMLPDASFAKHAIHRKRVKGASRDGHRAYLQSVYHYAHHVSKIRYGHKMKAELDAMKDQVKLAERGEESSIKPDDIEVAQQVLNEMNKRHELNMNPKGSSLAGMAGNIGFLFYLGASPASAVINLTQNVMVMLPQLAGKYGFVKAAKFMLQAMVDYMRHGVFQKGTKEAWVSLTRATNAAITADEKAMLNKLYKAGVLDLTQAHSIAARADTDQQNIKPGKQWARTGMRWAGALFHNAEVLNREVAALTAYRLMKAQQPGIASDVLKGDSAAIDQVAEMVYDGHGNYAASNRPRYMRSDVMKVLTQFKIYSQMMTYTLARNAVLAAKGDKTALKTLGVMFGTTWMMAGMMGMPTPVGLILYGLASLFDDDDDRTGEASFRLGLTEVFGAEVGELIAKGPVDAISGLNISGRTGLSDLWWRSPKEGTEGDDLIFHYVQQIVGPVLGIGVSAVRGMREFANGDIQRGVEAMSPKAVKDLAKAYRQATEGEQTRNGDSVIDDVGAWNVAMQAMGFSSAKMSQVYAARGYIKGKEKVIEDERSNLLADFFDAKRSGDEEAMRDVMERIKAFNSKHDRAETITGRTLMQSIKSRNRSMERTQAGVYLSKKREYLRGEGAFLDDEDDDE